MSSTVPTVTTTSSDLSSQSTQAISLTQQQPTEDILGLQSPSPIKRHSSKSVHYAAISTTPSDATPVPDMTDQDDEGEPVVVAAVEEADTQPLPSPPTETTLPSPPSNTPNESPDPEAAAPSHAEDIPELQIDSRNSSTNPIEQLTKTVGRFVMFGVLAPFIVASSVQGSNELLCETENEKKVEGFVNRLFCSVTELPRVFLASVLNFDIVGTIAYRQAFGHQV